MSRSAMVDEKIVQLAETQSDDLFAEMDSEYVIA